jgi:hypothetical protein
VPQSAAAASPAPEASAAEAKKPRAKKAEAAPDAPAELEAHVQAPLKVDGAESEMTDSPVASKRKASTKKPAADKDA